MKTAHDLVQMLVGRISVYETKAFTGVGSDVLISIHTMANSGTCGGLSLRATKHAEAQSEAKGWQSLRSWECGERWDCFDAYQKLTATNGPIFARNSLYERRPRRSYNSRPS